VIEWTWLAAGYYQKDSRAVLTTLLSDLAMYMHALDTRHMVGTSTSYATPPRDVQNAAGLDYLQPHDYANRVGNSLAVERGDPLLKAAEVNMPEFHATIAESYRAEYRDGAGKLNEFSGMDAPLLIGEHGRNRGIGDDFTPEYAQNMAIWVHNQAWATLFSGSAGIPMVWDSCYVLLGKIWANCDPPINTDVWEDIMSPHYQGITDFIQKIDFIGSDFQVVYPQVSFSSPPQAGYDNYSFNPWRLGNETAEDDAFQVPMPGLVSPSEFSARISPWLGTEGWCALSENPDWNPPVFTVSSAQAWTLRLKFTEKKGGVATHQLRLTVNNSALDPDKDVYYVDKECFWPNMPAGNCTVKIENVTADPLGQYALKVGAPNDLVNPEPDPHHAGFHFEGIVSPLRVYALRGPTPAAPPANQNVATKVVAWVHNRKFNIMDADTWSSPGVNVPAIINATVHFTGLTPSCSWTVEWWTDTTDLAGSASSTYQVSTDEDGNLNLVQGTNMPASILRDALVILTKN